MTRAALGTHLKSSTARVRDHLPTPNFLFLLRYPNILALGLRTKDRGPRNTAGLALAAIWQSKLLSGLRSRHSRPFFFAFSFYATLSSYVTRPAIPLAVTRGSICARLDASSLLRNVGHHVNDNAMPTAAYGWHAKTSLFSH